MAKIAGVQEVSRADLRPYERNAKKHSAEQVEKIARSIQEFGFLSPCLIDRDLNIIAGHGRVMAAEKLGLETVPCVFVEGLTDEQRRAYILADNRLTELGGWDEETLAQELAFLEDIDFDLSIIGFDEGLEERAKENKEERARETLADRFLVSPFSILDKRTGWWSARREAWKNLGIRSEIGRGNDGDETRDGLTFANSAQSPETYEKKNKYEAEIGHTVTWDEFFDVFPNAAAFTGTSIFDPVVCEIAYRWFSSPAAKILDPFAGGSVRGIVAALLDREYTGIDLSERQITANRNNWREISHALINEEGTAKEPTWIIGDSLNIKDLAPGEYDLIFTCPPYADLEVYSDDPADLSNMEYSDFLKAYREIIAKAVSMLKPDSFAVIVVGDVRDKKGNLRGFVSDTIQAFEDAGMNYYNEGILINSTGSAATRASRQFGAGRKPVKVHQNVLVFFADGDLHTINTEDAEEQERETSELIKERKGRFVQGHDKMLTFVKGDGKRAAAKLGPVNTETGDEYFEVIVDV